MRYTPMTLEVAFLLKEERLGRRSLAQQTGLSEMTIRLELERLQKKGLITTDRRGVTLSALGRERFSPLLKHIKHVAEPSLHSLSQDTVTQVALLSCPTTRPPWWYRDLVVREGGSALILIRYGPEGWCFSHNEEKVSDQNPHDERMIEGAFPLRREDDLLLIVSAPERKSAGLGLWRVITEILSETP
jgi:predicted transcriptional regulator